MSWVDRIINACELENEDVGGDEYMADSDVTDYGPMSVFCFADGYHESNANRLLTHSASIGDTIGMTLAKDSGATLYDMALIVAAEGGHADALALVLSWCDDAHVEPQLMEQAIHHALMEAAMNGHASTVALLKNHCDNIGCLFDVDMVLDCAAMSGHENVMRLARSWGAFMFEMAILCARGNGMSVSLLQKWLELREKAYLRRKALALILGLEAACGVGDSCLGLWEAVWIVEWAVDVPLHSYMNTLECLRMFEQIRSLREEIRNKCAKTEK